MRTLATAATLALACNPAVAGGPSDWWNGDWRMRTTVVRTTPWRDEAPRPVEAAVDFPRLLREAGVPGEFDPKSLRVVECHSDGRRTEIPYAWRSEWDARRRCEQTYLAWTAAPEVGRQGRVELYFDTADQRTAPPDHPVEQLPPENLLTNPGFEQTTEDRPDGWTTSPAELVRVGRFAHTTGERSLAIVVDENTPADASREAAVRQTIDVRPFAGQAMLFECDLLAERAEYGAPVSIELRQFRDDGSPILEFAVQPRWLSIELAEGQLVQFSERGRFSPEAATVEVCIRLRCSVRDADTGRPVTGPESHCTVWLDRIAVRPGERWPWPAETGAGFVEGALDRAPLNRGFEFTGLRRIVFNGASEGTLNAGRYNPDPHSVHWGLEAGTLEFWCRPRWDADDGIEHVFFDTVAYGHRLQSRLRKLDGSGGNRLEFTIADADGKLRTVRGPAPLKAGHWHHVAATWDFPKAQLQLFVDGKRVATEGPGDRPWPSSLVAEGGPKKTRGIGIMENDTRSLPMQAFIGGDSQCREHRGAEAVMDEFRVSDVARYHSDFAPPRDEFSLDDHTRVLFHFENERDGVHQGDDRFVCGHLACELPRHEEKTPLETLRADGTVERRMVVVRPHAPDALFEANRAESRLTVTRPFRELPDPRFVECRPRRVERVVNGAGDEFTIEVGGDFEPWMQSITFEHAEGSEATTLLPRWRANDAVVPFSVESLRATLAPNAADDAERAFEAFKYALAVTNYYDAHYCETLAARHRPRVSYTLAKALNVYPFDQCGPLNHTLRKLFLAAGISSSNASGTHHQFQQAFYEGDWRLFDLSPRVYWLNRDNRTVASRRAFEDDLYLKLRQGSGINSGIRGRRGRATFGTAERPHAMDFALRHGERVSVCWHNEGRWFELTGDREPIPLAKIPPYFGNGAIVFQPTGKGEAAALENLAVERADGGGRLLRGADRARPGSLVYRVHCPYILSDCRITGRYEGRQEGAVRASISFDDGKSWTELWQSAEPIGAVDLNLLDQVTARYAYALKIDLAPGATVADLSVRTTFVVSPLSLPGKLSRGDNRIRFVGGPPSAPVKTSCRWIERHRSDLGVSVGSIGYYLNGDEARRDVLTAPAGAATPLSVVLEGAPARAEVSIDDLPPGWQCTPSRRALAIAEPGEAATGEFLLTPAPADAGAIRGFEIVVRHAGRDEPRRLSVQVFAAEAPRVGEAEQAAECDGRVARCDSPALSGGAAMRFAGSGHVAFDFDAPRAGTYALWLRARWEPEASTAMTLAVDQAPPRSLRATSMIGFTDWTNPREAHTKMFAHFGEQYGHWSWYRVPEVELTAGRHRLTLGAEAGASIDAMLLLSQDPATDRAAMNLFQNWNYAPWQNPF